MQRATVLRLSRLGLGLALLALLVSRVRPAELSELVRKGDQRFLVLGLALLFFANPVLQALRLHVLVARYTRSVLVSFKVFSVGSFFNLMLPSNVGGDAVKLLYLRRMRAENWGGPFALLMLHRVTGMLTLLFAAGLYALADHERFLAALRAGQVRTALPAAPRYGLAIGAVLVIAGIGWAALSPRYRGRLVAWLRRFAQECGSALARVGVGAALKLLVLTFAFHAVRMLAFYVLVTYAGERIAFMDTLIVLATTAVAGVVPITVGGLGLMEGAVSMTLVLYGVSERAGIAIAIANRLVLLAGAGLGGLIYLGFRASDYSSEPSPASPIESPALPDDD